MSDPVERARALLAKATPGPLYAVHADVPLPDGVSCHDGMHPSPTIDEERWEHEPIPEAERYTVSTLPDRAGWETDGAVSTYCIRRADAELWAAAPTLLAELCDEVERLRDVDERLKYYASVYSCSGDREEDLRHARDEAAAPLRAIVGELVDALEACPSAEGDPTPWVERERNDRLIARAKAAL